MLTPWAQHPTFDPDAENALKVAFAGALLRNPNDPFKAALQTIGGTNSQVALKIAETWPCDPVVMAAQIDLIDRFGEASFLPSKIALSRRIFEIGEDTSNATKDRLAAYKLYAEVRGFISAGVNVDNSVTVQDNRRVMIMRDHGTNDEWQDKALTQQQKLIENAIEQESTR